MHPPGPPTSIIVEDVRLIGAITMDQMPNKAFFSKKNQNDKQIDFIRDFYFFGHNLVHLGSHGMTPVDIYFWLLL